MERNKKNINIVFMGSPSFAVPSLTSLLEEGYLMSCVVTVPDKPAGRGRKTRESDIKQYALTKGLTLLQPWNLKDPDFLLKLKSFQPDIIIVVAFRMLPREVWTIPRLGTINLHASLLPAYRGAAPINRAIMNGETITGLTTFLINEHLDHGNILMQQKIHIGQNDTFGDLHDIMKQKGAELLVKTVEQYIHGTITPVPQELPPDQRYLTAPKIIKENTFIRWDQPVESILNFIRGLSPHPAASLRLFHSETGETSMRIFKASMSSSLSCKDAPKLMTDGKHFIRVGLPDGIIDIDELQLKDRKKMKSVDFLRGFRLENGWEIVDEH